MTDMPITDTTMTEAPSPVHACLIRPSLVDYPGHQAAVFYMAGCNFRCGFCHNATLLETAGHTLSWADLHRRCRRFQDDWVEAVVLSGGEPALAHGLEDLCRFFKQELGWAVKLDTNGSCPDRLRSLLPLIDMVAMDIKTSLAGYPALTGFECVENLVESMALIRANARDYTFRTTVIEEVHDEAVMHEIGALLRDARRMTLQPFVPRDNLPDARFRRMRRTSPAHMRTVREWMSAYVEEINLVGA